MESLYFKVVFTVLSFVGNPEVTWYNYLHMETELGMTMKPMWGLLPFVRNDFIDIYINIYMQT